MSRELGCCNNKLALPIALFAGALFLGGNAVAQTTDPLLQQYGAGDFYFEYGHDVQTFEYDEVREIVVCVPEVEGPVAAGDPTQPLEAIPLEVRWDDNTRVVEPGDCLTVEAREVSLSPAEPLPLDTILEGTIETREVGATDDANDQDW